MERDNEIVGSETSRKEQFRDDFNALLIKKRVSDKARPWFFRHLEAWGRWLRERRYRANEAILAEWVRELGRKPTWSSFQIRQALQAVEWSHGEILGEEWVAEVAEELKQAARDLISMVDTIRVLKR